MKIFLLRIAMIICFPICIVVALIVAFIDFMYRFFKEIADYFEIIKEN